MTKQTYRFDEKTETFVPVNEDRMILTYAEQIAADAAKKKIEDAKLFRGYL